MIWFKPYTLDDLRAVRNTNMTAHLGFEFTEVGPDFLKGRLPVDQRTTQPFGIFHGGASCVLSESLGSIASWMTIDPDQFRAFLDRAGLQASDFGLGTPWFALGGLKKSAPTTR